MVYVARTRSPRRFHSHMRWNGSMMQCDDRTVTGLVLDLIEANVPMHELTRERPEVG
jgi:hypothetical protein